jgi:chromosome partitioning protein
MSNAKVISFINYKGGVGKTTTTYHVGCSLAGHHQKRVLLIDIDPQTNLTFLCAPVEKWQAFKKKPGTIATVYKRYQEKIALDTKRYIWRSPVQVLGGQYRIEGLDLIPCDIDLIGEDLGGGYITGAFPNLESLRKNAQLFLKERGFIRAMIAEVGDQYDYILIDCPPNLYLMTQNALAASDYYVVTAIPDHLSTIGLSILHQKVERIGKLIDSAHTFAGRKTSLSVAKLGGVVFVKVRLGGSRLTAVHESKMGEVRVMLGPNKCFKRFTTELIGYSEAAEASVPIWALDSDNARRAADKDEYQSITREFMKRF